MKKTLACGGVLSVLMGLLLLWGLGVAFGGEADQKAAQVLAKITLTPEMAKASGFEATPGNPAIRPSAAGPLEVKIRKVEPKVIEHKDADGGTFAVGLQFTCDPRFINHFTIGGQPLKAKQFSYSVGTISWQAGDGWPVYSTFCPNPGYSTSMYYPGAKIHQLVPSIEGQNYFVGCLQSGICASNGSGQICFAVNDDRYPDNRGYFVVNIYGIVP